MAKEDNFLEIDTVEEANKVDLTTYSFIRFSETRNKYLFAKRMRAK